MAVLLNKNNSGELYIPPPPSSCSCDTIPLAVKRIMQEARELANDPSTEYSAAPLEVSITYLSAHTKTETPSPLLHPCRVTLGRYLCMHSFSLQRITLTNLDYRSGTAQCAGLLAPTLRGDCTTFVSGYLQNTRFDRQASCCLLPTADSN
jgi:hypothetical protein